jgi:hypothetical protein
MKHEFRLMRVETSSSPQSPPTIYIVHASAMSRHPFPTLGVSSDVVFLLLNAEPAPLPHWERPRTGVYLYRPQHAVRRALAARPPRWQVAELAVLAAMPLLHEATRRVVWYGRAATQRWAFLLLVEEPCHLPLPS